MNILGLHIGRIPKPVDADIANAEYFGVSVTDYKHAKPIVRSLHQFILHPESKQKMAEIIEQHRREGKITPSIYMKLGHATDILNRPGTKKVS